MTKRTRRDLSIIAMQGKLMRNIDTGEVVSKDEVDYTVMLFARAKDGDQYRYQPIRFADLTEQDFAEET